MITYENLKNGHSSIAVVGLGYVGLPLAVALSRHFNVVGFDISERRIAELMKGEDLTREVTSHELKQADIQYTSDPTRLSDCGLVIVAVPTPIDQHRRPNLNPVISASTTVGKNLASGAVVVYESTVYPGLTEDICIPLLEAHSGMRNRVDFFVGYSPERINPGDKEHTLETIVKVVSGQTPETLDLVASVYATVVKAGVHRASSIAVAEAAKVIENTQRDLNIALMNELSMIFDHLGIDTLEVLEAAGTKWNFLKFSPGLVGGHCIGVDPYYLTYKAEEIGHHPQVILAGRRINDYVGKYVAETCIKMLAKQDCMIRSARIGVLGLTFKENVPDLRNTRVIDIIHELNEYCSEVLVHDPMALPDEAESELDLMLSDIDDMNNLDALILAVPHSQYKSMSIQRISAMFKKGVTPMLLDVKGMFDPAEMKELGYNYWRL
ncbi:MAG: nucleotide sugar dehydrogenase [Desulfovibrio sp.]|uniref:nucleotide sugar dehydrogenase n=1 Tax=Desulfovibrio sp. 7SRBS1 TaxID=3378064 RepID=UPI003B3D434D